MLRKRLRGAHGRRREANESGEHDALGIAVREAGIARFRPIFLTSVTTFVGLIPLMFESDPAAFMVIPLAISLAFGVAFASTITLFLVPSLYLILEDLQQGARRRTRSAVLLGREPLGAPSTPGAAPRELRTNVR
jgi:Cu/Ag efflux pump CusA